MKARLDNDLDDALYDDADVSTEPFTSQAAFGRGLWKNPIKFVSAAPDLPSSNSMSKSTAQSVRERYLAIVFPNGQSQPKSEANPLCGVCGEPVKEADARAHYISPGHQAALPRAPIPSSIDRTRMGLKYLEKHGFDLDARLGLGATGQGMLFPIVPKEKRDKLGLGIDKKEEERRKAAGIKGTGEAKELKLDAGKVRKLVKAEKKKHKKLQRMFYGNDEVEKYLGELDG